MAAELVRSGLEIKALVPEDAACPLIDAVQRLLPPDPYAAPTGVYPVSSLYLDTPDQASYRHENRGKWRLRRYGLASDVFAEHKAKPEPGMVHKRRTAIPVEQIGCLPDRGPDWFVAALQQGGFRPRCIIAYERQAFVGTIAGTPVRLTLDRSIRSVACLEFVAPAPLTDGILLTDGRILEIKVAGALPNALDRLLTAFALRPEAFSKYRRAVDRL
jgi:hypothetical protein